MSENLFESGKVAPAKTKMLSSLDRLDSEGVSETVARSVDNALQGPTLYPPLIVESTSTSLWVRDANPNVIDCEFKLFRMDTAMPTLNNSGRVSGRFVGLIPYTTYMVKAYLTLQDGDGEREVMTEACFTTMPDELQFREPPEFLRKFDWAPRLS